MNGVLSKVAHCFPTYMVCTSDLLIKIEKVSL